MILQIYRIHLINGDVIDTAEDYELPFEKGLIAKFSNTDDNTIFTIGDGVSGFCYIPKKSILYISTGDVITEE